LLPVDAGVADYQPTEATKIISSDGVVLASIYEENREFIPITSIPKNLQNATVAIEDSRFFKHRGVDFVGVGRAFYQNFRRGYMSQGGSTLTQQLARNIYLTREKKLSRKLQEMFLAIQLERNYSKEQILELYLNQVNYGSGAYGVETASKIYFGKDAKDLSLAECAMIAGMPQRPSGYSPYKDMKAAVSRRNVVLGRMAQLGYITPDERDKARAETIHLVGLKRGGFSKWKAPWFVSYVRSKLIDKYGEDLVYKGGLRVYTTLNYEMQQVAERELRRHVESAKWQNTSQGALISIDPTNGYIKAMVGGVNPDYSKDQYNRAVQARRQPGSAFKAFVYTAAIDNGYDENYRLSNRRVTFGSGSHAWSPRNYDGRYGGTYTIKMAVAHSVNICAVRMADKIGIDKVIQYARALGITSPLSRNLSLALGSCGVSPLELCSAYSVFAANGVRADPTAIVRITTTKSDGTDDDIIEDNKPTTRQVLSSETADVMNDIFRAVVTRGTGRAASAVPNAHGKTGTTSDQRDAWFVGYTPELCTAVWVGNDDYGKEMRHASGGGSCAPTWTSFMLRALEIKKREPKLPVLKTDTTASTDKKVEDDKSADAKSGDSDSTQGPRKVTVRICNESGCLATNACPRTHRQTFDAGKEPQVTCPLHPGSDAPTDSDVGDEQKGDNKTPSGGKSTPSSTKSEQYVTKTICVDSGQLATPYCPQTISRRYLASEAPTKTCRLHKAPVE
jgi:penicillin-binding protein 1A